MLPVARLAYKTVGALNAALRHWVVLHSVAHVKREVPRCLRVIEPLSGNTKLAHGRSSSGRLAIFARCPSPRVACGAYRTRSPGVAVSSQLTNVAIAGSFSEGAQLANSLSSCGS
jgi:hypothetical protein